MSRIEWIAIPFLAPLAFGFQTGATEPKAVIVNPAPISRPEPTYTDEARAAHIQGDVGLAIVIDEEGRVAQARVVRPLGYGLDENAVQAVSQWRFSPGARDGKAIKTGALIDVSFRLNAPQAADDRLGWRDIPLAFAVSFGVSLGIWLLLRFSASTLRGSKVLLFIVFLFFIVFPFYRVFTGNFYSNGKFMIATLSRWRGFQLHAVKPGALLVAAPCAVAAVYLLELVRRTRASRVPLVVSGGSTQPRAGA